MSEEEKIKLVMETNYNNRSYKDLATLIPKRFMILIIKALSVKVLIPIPLATWALNEGLITGWIFFLIIIFTFSVRSFEKIIEKGLLSK